MKLEYIFKACATSTEEFNGGRNSSYPFNSSLKKLTRLGMANTGKGKYLSEPLLSTIQKHFSYLRK